MRVHWFGLFCCPGLQSTCISISRSRWPEWSANQMLVGNQMFLTKNMCCISGPKFWRKQSSFIFTKAIIGPTFIDLFYYWLFVTPYGFSVLWSCEVLNKYMHLSIQNLIVPKRVAENLSGPFLFSCFDLSLFFWVNQTKHINNFF